MIYNLATPIRGIPIIKMIKPETGPADSISLAQVKVNSRFSGMLSRHDISNEIHRKQKILPDD